MSFFSFSRSSKSKGHYPSSHHGSHHYKRSEGVLEHVVRSIFSVGRSSSHSHHHHSNHHHSHHSKKSWWS